MSAIKKRLLVLLFIVFSAASASPAAAQIVALGAKDSDIVNMAALASFNIGG